MHEVEFSALKYYNNIISEECLYIGMLFHNLTTGKRDFKYISNFKRFQVFDDEADVDFVRLYLHGIKQQVEENIFNYNSRFSISEFKRIYVNEFRFTDVTKISVEESEDYVSNLTRLYLKFDFSKEKRLSILDEKSYLRRILSSSNLEFSSSKVSGAYNENITFDYIIRDVAIKLFSFKEKDISKMIPSAKQWSFSASELKGKYRIIYLYDDAEMTTEMEIVLNILKENAVVYPLDYGIEYILKTVS